MKVETHEKRQTRAEMVLYDGTLECAEFIEKWSAGRVVSNKTRGLFILVRSYWTYVTADHYIVRGCCDRYLAIPKAEAYLRYKIGA